MSTDLKFGTSNQPNFQLSPQSPHGFTEDGIEWPTVDHYVKAHMFEGEKYEPLREKIRSFPRLRKAQGLVDANPQHIRKDWDEVKEDIMLHALRLKFQDKDLKHKLLNTSSRKLVYQDPYESYWGIGRDERGPNRLGKLLEKVRDELKAEQ